MTKVIVGMSGGVDSAVAAYLLKEAGYEVIGMTLRTWEAVDGAESRCCEIDDARETAWKLHIRYHAPNCIAAFNEKVKRPFFRSYIEGQTPNPCIECNRYLKWERMPHYAAVLDAMRARPEDCLFVDDRVCNLEGAVAAGMQAVQMARAAFLPDKLWDGPVVRDFEALNKWIEA